MQLVRWRPHGRRPSHTHARKHDSHRDRGAAVALRCAPRLARPHVPRIGLGGIGRIRWRPSAAAPSHSRGSLRVRRPSVAPRVSFAASAHAPSPRRPPLWAGGWRGRLDDRPPVTAAGGRNGRSVRLLDGARCGCLTVLVAAGCRRRIRRAAARYYHWPPTTRPPLPARSSRL